MRWNRTAGFALFIVALPVSAAGAAKTARGLVERSIAYHDPDGVWGKAPLLLAFEESRPEGGVRRTEVTIDVAGERFSWASRRDGRVVAGRLAGEACELFLDGSPLDGSPEISAEDAQALGLSCETLTRRRDYYAYLWGLPMKLLDPGTRIDPAPWDDEFDGREVLAVRVTYDEAVGDDTWIFYFDRATAALTGYRFFHDESANDGEYVTLEGEERVGGLRLPKTRAWYYNSDDGHLGTDTLVEGRLETPAPARAAGESPLAAFEPFLGIWKGMVNAEKRLYDVARWERAIGGRVVRIVHSVDDGVYGGETIVTWDRSRAELVYFYFTTAGFYTSGTMRFDDEGRLVSRETVTGNENGVTEVEATQELLPDGGLRVETRMLRNGEWEDRGEVIYRREPGAVLRLPATAASGR